MILRGAEAAMQPQLYDLMKKGIEAAAP